MSCPELLHTQALMDGELDSAGAAEAARHAEGCEECRTFRTDAARVSGAIKTDLARHRAPDALRVRLAHALDRETERSAPVPLRRRSFWFGAASGAGVSALAAALAIFAILPPSAATLADAITDAHTRAVMSGHIVEVVSSNHHTVKPWFSRHVAVSPPVAEFAAQGFVLAGGRVETIAGAQSAVVAYRHGAHEVDLFAWPDRGSPLPDVATVHGYRLVFWKQNDLNLAAVSDMERSELDRFVGLVRSEGQ